MANNQILVPEYLAERFPVFLANRQKDVDAILAALDKDDFETIRILGHNMIGTGRLYGLELLTTIGPLMEQAALKHESGEIRKHAGEISNYLSSIVWKTNVSTSRAGAPESSRDSLPEDKPGLPKLKALIVDDSDATREALALILESALVNVVGQAGNGQQAIALCAELQPDLVFLDVVMPGMSGMEVLESIRGTSPEAKIVMVTSISERKTVLQSRDLGAYDYVLKPFEPADIEDKIQRMHDTMVKNK
jgi:two-component system chemotaxis response regulator CheY